MNHLIMQSHSSRMLEVLVNKASGSAGRYYICGHCMRNHIIFLSNGRNLSTYVSALKLMLKRKQNLKKCDSRNQLTSKYLQNKRKTENRFTELVKVSYSKSKETKMTVHEMKPCDVTAFAEEPGMTFGILEKNKTSYDSTRSYDPDAIIPKPIMDNILEDLTNKYSKNSELVKRKDKNYSVTSSNFRNVSIQSEKDLHRFNLNPKIKIISNESKNVPYKSKKENIQKDIGKVLPFTSVEIFPMPKKLQQNIWKKSRRVIEELAEPKTDENLEIPEETPSFLNIIQEESLEKPVAVEEEHPYFTSRNFEQILVNTSLKELEYKNLLLSFIDVTVNNEMVEEALGVLKLIRRKPLWKDFVIANNCTELYNILLHSYSSKGDWSTVSQITDWMKSDGVKFNSQTYAGIIDCLGRVNVDDFGSESAWKDIVVKNLGKLYVDNYSLNDLFTKSTLTEDKEQTILSTLTKIVPFFEIEPTKIKLNSNCVLLKDLFKEGYTLQPQLENNFTSETLEKLVEEQLLLEKKYFVPVKSVYVDYTSQNSFENKIKCETLINKWREMLHKGFVRNLKTAELEHKKYSDKLTLYVYLKCLPVETYVDVLMENLRTLVEYSGGFSPSVSSLHSSIGENIYQRYLIKRKSETGLIDRTEKLFKKYCSWYACPSGPAQNTRQEWQMLLQDYQDGYRMDLSEIRWPFSVRKALGEYLLNLIFKEVRIDVGETKDKKRLIPVFYPVMRFRDKKSNEEIKCHPIVSKLFHCGKSDTLFFDANQVPMVCPPKPWKSVNHGGYLILPTTFIRQSNGKADKKVNLKKVSAEQLYSVFDSLNSLQAVPWTINERILDIVLEVFQNGGCDKLDVPKLPDMSSIPKEDTSGLTLKERIEAHQKRMKITQERQNQYGLWCEALYRLSLANHYRNRVFWFPQNFDFRGRVYPVPPHLNHLGADLFRSLLLFAKGKPMGPKGLDWLKIHTINLTGSHKKKSVKERLDYANSILPKILDSAENPLTGDMWWTKSEEPWQTLAACIEIRNVMASPEPEQYKSKFPIHQDGSCNGLQHYAALGRDTIGAESVNLSPSQLPQDVYSVVTQIVEEHRQRDALNGVEIARILGGFVKRKVIKQTIMTTVYGVTRYGAKLQIAGQLEDIDEFPKEHVWKAAVYLTNKTFDSLQQMFTSAKEIQDWFLHCAMVISQKKDFIQWVSPMGLPILQPYGKLKGSTTVPNTMKQKNAFAPNFVHSLDSSHMMLTSQYCEQAGLTFASIHDCFWTHPSTVDVMNDICRQQFISLHSQPILQNLSDFFIECYLKDERKSEKNKEAYEVFSSVPKTGNFDLKSVRNSVYFFS